MTSSNEWKLPTTVRPTLYTLTLEPDLDSFTFDGSETIAIQVDEPTSDIRMNSAEIAIRSATLTLPDGSERQPDSISFDEEKETVSFDFTDAIPPGTAHLTIEFTGELNDKLRGFYRSSYTDAEGDQRWMATTQFESTDARRAFPCWDEPAVKAAFDITLVVPSELEAVSNTEPVSITDTGDGKKIVHYAQTPVMSTYLLAFIVGDLACVQDRTRDGVLMRVWATRGNEAKGQFALETSMALLDYFHDYFGVPYPLSKLDHIAIPDFAAGAMENWGAITYREVALLVDPVESSAGTREIVAAIISHEMAHQWFGDLVTMEWWDDLWLNESFASWMGDKAVDYLHPEWEMWTQFLTHDTGSALNLDGLRNSHPIEQPVNNPAEIGELFDAISYSKGGSVLRMLEHYLGEDAFRAGLRIYIQRHQYANARTRDLWNALGEASGQPVAEIMDSWTSQTGYPVLDVSVNRSGDSIEVGLSQSRFLYDEILDQDEEPDGTIWKAPVTARTASNAEPARALMETADFGLTLQPASYGSGDEWIKVNPDQSGFFRVQYPDEEIERLKAPIASLTLPARDRLGLQSDAYALAKAGRIPASAYLNLVEAYSNENDPSVASDLAAALKPGVEARRERNDEVLLPLRGDEDVGVDAEPVEAQTGGHVQGAGPQARLRSKVVCDGARLGRRRLGRGGQHAGERRGPQGERPGQPIPHRRHPASRRRAPRSRDRSPPNAPVRVIRSRLAPGPGQIAMPSRRRFAATAASGAGSTAIAAADDALTASTQWSTRSSIR